MATVDYNKQPVTEAEIEVWRAMSPEGRALFGRILSNAFRRLLAREGDNFPAWVAAAVELDVELR